MQVTVFSHVRNTDQPFYRDIMYVLERIRSGSSRNLIKEIRESGTQQEQYELKLKLPAICFSGKFNKRNDESIIEHSGLICLDFDKYKKRTDMYEDRDIFLKSKYVFSVFVSPSGNGLKVLVKIPADASKHKSYFNALGKYFKNSHFDTTSKNVSRVCYESYDPTIYINENSVVWEEMLEDDYTEVRQGVPTIPIDDENKIADILVKWWSKNFPMNEGQRNNSVFTLAMAFNEFGVAKSYASTLLSSYAQEGFTAREIFQTIDNAYDKNKDKFRTKFYEDRERVDVIRESIKRGDSKNDILHQIKSFGLSGGDAENVISKIEEEDKPHLFWSENPKNGLVKIVPVLYKKFLEDNGFFKYYPSGSTQHIFVRVVNNLISNSSEDEIKDFVLSYLLSTDNISIYNFFAERTKFFSEDFLTLLSPVDVLFIKDTSGEAFIYFKNCAVKITKESIESIDYIDLAGYVWKDHVIDRMYFDCDYTGCDFEKFMFNICAKDEDRFKSLKSTTGYLLHQYKDLSKSMAVILNDELISDNPEGGTGKGLFVKAISKMKKVVTINGKQFSFTQSFPYQLVSADTQILCFDDVKKGFDFESLFSDITEGITLEKKNKDAIKIPYENSPKIIITTNYAIKGKGNSFSRRKWEQEFHNHYREDFTPFQEFGRMFFSDWDEDEWCQFDMFMIKCLQFYMVNGMIRSKFVNLKIRQLSAETCHEFVEYCGLINENKPSNIFSRFTNMEKVYKADLFDDFVSDYSDFAPRSKRAVSKTEFNRWLLSYALFKEGIAPEEGRDARGRWFRLKKKSVIYQPETLDL
jgi:hypothetical protein